MRHQDIVRSGVMAAAVLAAVLSAEAVTYHRSFRNGYPAGNQGVAASVQPNGAVLAAPKTSSGGVRVVTNRVARSSRRAETLRALPDVLTAIQTRKSVRKFNPNKPVDDATIETILRAGMCAPSAMDKRPWEFVVVRDGEKLRRLGERLPYSRVGNGAQAAIVVCGSLDNGLPGRGKEYWIHDCSAASMNILLAAHGLGLGAVWTGVYPGEERIAAVREILAIPDGYMPLNVIPLGYPAENPPAKEKWNAAKVHKDAW